MNYRYWLGIDPGLDGAFAVIEEGRVAATENTPTITTKIGSSAREYDLEGMRAGIAGVRNAFGNDGIFATIEQVPVVTRDQRGAIATIKLGRSQALWEAFLCGFRIPYQLVLPAKWKKEMGIPARSDKGVSIALAARLFPNGLDHFRHGRGFGDASACDGRAEAALLAEWGRRNLGGKS